MLERVKDLSRLEQALRPPKARGGFGELLLENLLRDRLPSGAYTMQYGFPSGERVDAVVHVGRLVPIDAKFPLDNYERMVEADGDDERLLHEQAFARDVKGHVDAIATKYIRAGGGHLRLRADVPARPRRSTTSSSAARREHCSATRTTSGSSPSRRRRSRRSSR